MMLALTLREEFRGRRLKGTAIELANDNKTGATQLPASTFLEITYPTGDLLKAIEAMGPGQGRSLVLLGERGQGKSHLMAALYHALTDTQATQDWLKAWSERLQNPKLAQLPLRSGMFVISESLHRQRYKFLWDLLFECHPHGKAIEEKWKGLGEKKTDIPSDKLLLELLKAQPTALILDEYQTWYDGLTNTKQYPWRNWAFTFIQLLSEIAKEHPELLVLMVSVRNGSTDAYQQIHRVGPAQIDFKGPHAEHDRRRLLLHRLFSNRLQIQESDIEKAISDHVSEYFRLAETAPAEQERKRQDFRETWPFAPHLMQLLEDQVLVATDAQETRDLIRILADLFKSRGDSQPILTAADFSLDDDKSGIAALLGSVANQHHANLREKAQRNLTAVREALKNPSKEVPHLSEIVGALWLRSLAVGNLAGAEPNTLHIDITHKKAIDDNSFQIELANIVENSFNIHHIGEKLIFREDENPQAKLLASAKNDKLFADGSDKEQLAREVRYVLGGAEEVARGFRIIVLPEDWLTNPWGRLLDESEHPDRWDDKIPIIVLPESPELLGKMLGFWLKDHVQKRRNTPRFLLPDSDTHNMYGDRELLIMARAIVKAKEWKAQNHEYDKLFRKYQNELRTNLKQRFDRFAVLDTWNFSEPSLCTFQVEKINAQGNKIPQAIEDFILESVFVPEEFEDLALAVATQNESVAKLLKELQEPRPGEKPCIPWLGETQVKEKLIRLCARGKIALNLRDMEYLQQKPGEDKEKAWQRMKGRLGTGKHLEETSLLLPQAVPHAQGPGKDVPKEGPQPLPPLPGTNLPTQIPGGTIFTPPPGHTASGPVGNPFRPPEPPKQQQLSAPPTSALNLLGKIEAWGIGTATQLSGLSICVSSLTGAQLKKLIQSLPDGLLYELGLQKEES